jgi:hypothetical protein
MTPLARTVHALLFLSADPVTVDELAGAARVDASMLHRVLRALASDGVFAEQEPGVFANTPASELLLSNGWREFAHLFGGVFFRAVGDLARAVRSGGPTFGDFYAWLREHPDERAAFDGAMAGEKDGAATRLANLDWREGEIVVDVGGGNGALLVALIRRRPELRGIVFDLPETVRDEAALGDRIQFVAGSFFERVPEGDAYVLSGIVHNWDDERATAILRTIAASARPRARVVATESVVAAGNEPSGAKWLDLLMLVLGGRERTEPEWRRLLEAADLEPIRIEDGLVEARCP